jgi:methionyl-tRNA formyltransferase
VNWAVYHGETETGVSIIHMTPRLDAGPVIAQARTPIGADETAELLEVRLAEIGADLIPETIRSLEAGTSHPIPQDALLASKAPRLKKTDGQIDWTRPAVAIKNHIRAVQPWPKADTYWHRPGGVPLRLIVGPVTVVKSPSPTAPSGRVLVASDDDLVIAAGEGALAITTLQPAGKRMLSAQEFLRGYPVQQGQRFGPA